MAKVQALRKWSRSKLSASEMLRAGAQLSVELIDSRYVFTSAVLITFRVSDYVTWKTARPSNQG